MESLNYHHLHYFWVVAREGSIARACEVLGLAQPTISGQIAALERSVGGKLFLRSGRGLVLSETGRLVFGHAQHIFAAGADLQRALQGRAGGPASRLTVGVADVLPKMLVYRLLEPVRRLPEPPQLVCLEDKSDRLLAELVQHNLDVVLTDSPHNPALRVKVHYHLFGECALSWLAARTVANQLPGKFPQCLDGAPVLMPTQSTTMRSALDAWFDRHSVVPRVVAEFADSALMKVFGQNGFGAFPAPQAVEDQVSAQYGVAVIGRADSVRERVYGVTLDRKLRHPALLVMTKTAQDGLFTGKTGR